MGKIPHGFEVGMYWLNGVGAGGASTLAQLKYEMQRAYEGEQDIPYEACNVIHSAGDPNTWASPASRPHEPTGAGATKQQRIDNNVDGWMDYLRTIEDLTAELGIPVGRLRGTISRDLCGLHEGFNTSETLKEWELVQDIEPFVTELCTQIVAEGLEPYVAGWFLGNEVYSSTHYPDWDDTTIGALAQTVQTAQLAEGCEFPFYWSEYVEADLAARKFWHVVNQEWLYTVPDTFQDWVDAVINHEAATPAKVILQLNYYPWVTANDQLRYRRRARNANDVLSLELTDNGPWRNWSTFLDADEPYSGEPGHAYRTKFPKSGADPSYPSSVLQFQPKIGLNEQRITEQGQPAYYSYYVGHVDAHQNIRVLMDMRRQWADVRGDDRMTGFWIHAWNQTDATRDIWHQWTETGADKYRYAEAVQSEFGAGEEALAAVWLDGSQNVITTRIVSVDVDEVTPPKNTRVEQPFYIKYHIAPEDVMRVPEDPNELVLGEFVLGQRPEVEIRIYHTDPAPDVLVRTITAGYNENRYPSPRVTPPGQYVGVYPHTVPPPTNPPPVLPKPMEGACAYWDGLWDEDHDGAATAGTNAPFDPEPQHYRAELVINGDVASSFDFEKRA